MGSALGLTLAHNRTRARGGALHGMERETHLDHINPRRMRMRMRRSVGVRAARLGRRFLVAGRHWIIGIGIKMGCGVGPYV